MFTWASKVPKQWLLAQIKGSVGHYFGYFGVGLQVLVLGVQGFRGGVGGFGSVALLSACLAAPSRGSGAG